MTTTHVTKVELSKEQLESIEWLRNSGTSDDPILIAIDCLHIDDFVDLVKVVIQKFFLLHKVISVNFVMREDDTGSPVTIKEYRNAPKEEVVHCLDKMAEFRKMLVGG